MHDNEEISTHTHTHTFKQFPQYLIVNLLNVFEEVDVPLKEFLVLFLKQRIPLCV